MKKQIPVSLIAVLVAVGMLAFVFTASAQTPTPAANAAANYVYQGPCRADVNGGGANLTTCVISLYKWGLGAGVLLALIMIIFAGYKYITSGGNAQSVTSAKEMFASSIIGLIVLFCAVVILRTVNPQLTNFSNIDLNLNVVVPSVTPPPMSTPTPTSGTTPTPTNTPTPTPTPTP